MTTQLGMADRITVLESRHSIMIDATRIKINDRPEGLNEVASPLIGIYVNTIAYEPFRLISNNEYLQSRQISLLEYIHFICQSR